MGWLQKAVSFLKSAGQQNKAEQLPLSEIQDWLQQRAQEIVERNDLLAAVREQAALLREKRGILQTQLDIWQKKTRLHPQVNEIMPLFRETRQLLDTLLFSSQPAVGEVVAVNQELEKKVPALIQKIEAGEFAHNFGFLLETTSGPETENFNPLLVALLDFDALRKRLDLKIVQSNYNCVEVISGKAELLRKVAAHLEQLKEDLELKKSRLLIAEQKKLEKEELLQQLRNDDINLDLNALKNKKQQLQQQIEEKEVEVISFFSKRRPLLQQYQKMDPSNGLVFSYIADPLSSFIQDEGLFIVEVFEKVNTLLVEGKLSLNQEALVSSLSVLEGKQGKYLVQVKEDYKLLQKELQQLKSQVRHNFFVVKIDDAAFRLDHYLKQVKKLQEEISIFEEKVAKMQMLALKEQQEIQDLIKSGLQKSISITL